ncbi:MAG: MBL fold metallo-hydrolase [Cyclobacteriaceae bacterium]|nr:MBL fold metallo-hydrolase [Cyclobacteriaceae bacterium]
MIVTFLGTGTSQGVPVIACDCLVCSSTDYKDKRLRSSIHIEVDGVHVNIDIGPDFRQQMLVNNITKMDAILITHEHKDHTAGLDDVRSFNFAQGKDMPLYGRIEVLEQVTTEFAYIFAIFKYPGVPSIEKKPILNEDFSIEKVGITPIEVLHHKLPVFGFRVENFAYITDANYISEKEKKKLSGLNVLVLNALQIEKHLSHFTLSEAIKLIKELKPKQAYLTHISHKLGLSRDIEPTLPSNVSLAYDGLRISI